MMEDGHHLMGDPSIADEYLTLCRRSYGNFPSTRTNEGRNERSGGETRQETYL